MSDQVTTSDPNLRLLAELGYRVSFARQEDGQWVAQAIQQRVHLARAASQSAAAARLLQLVIAIPPDPTDDPSQTERTPAAESVPEVIQNLEESAAELAEKLNVLIKSLDRDSYDRQEATHRERLDRAARN